MKNKKENISNYSDKELISIVLNTEDYYHLAMNDILQLIKEIDKAYIYNWTQFDICLDDIFRIRMDKPYFKFTTVSK